MEKQIEKCPKCGQTIKNDISVHNGAKIINDKNRCDYCGQELPKNRYK